MEKELVLIHPEVKSDCQVLDACAAVLLDRGYVKPSYIQAVKERELSFPTGILMEGDIGLAMPHADRGHVIKSGFAVAVLDEPVTFKAMGAPNEEIAVRLVVMLAIDDPQQQLEMLSDLVTVFDDPDTMQAICDAQDAATVCDIMCALE